MSVVLDDLPALMWHAELGRSLPDLWSGGRHRGAQLHDLRAAVTLWATRYGQRGDDLRLSAGARLGGEIAVQIPAAQLSAAGD